jgi:hypothetical protein
MSAFARITSLVRVFTAVMAGTALLVPATASPVIAADPSVSITVNGSTELATTVGTTITAAATISGFTPVWCDWEMSILATINPDSEWYLQYRSETHSAMAPSEGKCPPLTLVMPNLADLVGANAGDSITAMFTLTAFDAPSSALGSNEVFVTFGPSSLHPTVTSTQPIVFWTLSNTKPVVGEEVNMSFYAVGFPPDWSPSWASSGPCSELGSGDKFWAGAQSSNDLSHIDFEIPNPWNTFSFIQPSPADAFEQVQAQTRRCDSSLNLVFFTYAHVRVADPPTGDFMPDGRIRKGSRAYAGNNTYNTTGLEQSKTGAKARGDTIKFGISVQNDGLISDRFKLRATGTASAMYSVTYWHGTTNITAAVVAGTFKTPSLAPGTTYLVTAKVKVKWNATKGSSTTRRVIITSVGDNTMQDAVRFIGQRL